MDVECRCSVCGEPMLVVPSPRVFGYSWRCASEGFLWHWQKEREAAVAVQ